MKAGKDEEFGRVHNMKTDFSTPPDDAVAIRPGIQVTLCGITVNDNMQIIKKDGSAIGNLYAVGVVSFDGSFRPSPCAVGIWQGRVTAESILGKTKK